jgi:UDP-glucose:glycoprotein glucosyltransferase
MYERLLKVMMGSVVLHASKPVTFWLVREFLSSKFVEAVPALERALEAQIRFPPAISWPEFLIDGDGAKIGIRDDLQRLVWASKLLFLDGLFHAHQRIVFVDADAVVVGDVAELLTLKLGMAPYAMAPFCSGENMNEATKGHRFWESGFWQNHLEPHNETYKISALFVVDVATFGMIGDGLRTTYQYMGPDANSLQNLDQDLPNYLNGGDRRSVALASLPQEWLYCESWCNARAKAKAKAFDMCQNPATKEYKLDVARRVADPLWSALDDYFASARTEPVAVAVKAPAGSSWKWSVRGADEL